MDLSTNYLGLRLRTPLVPSASPLAADLDNLRRMEDAGAAAVVLHSLFEEQLSSDAAELRHHLSYGTQSFGEALTYFPEPTQYQLGPDEYLEHISAAKSALGIPVIASLNGTTPGGWTRYARQMQLAGADALELNIYSIPTDPLRSADDVERNYLEIVNAVKWIVTIPVAVKLAPYFSNLANMAWRLDEAGANALVMFNRFYQPDIDLDALEIRPHVLLSTPQALRLPLTWVGILHGRVRANLAATGGVHTAQDVLKLLMAGADVTMLCSALLKNGIDHLRIVEEGLRAWMQENEYSSVRQLKGSMSQRNCADASAFERAHYISTLRSYSRGT